AADKTGLREPHLTSSRPAASKRPTRTINPSTVMAEILSQPEPAPSRRLYPNTPPEGVDQDGIYCEQPWPDTPLNDEPEFPWPAEKFGMQHDDLFEKLAPRFNMCSVPIQSTANFALDVQYAAEMASTPQELYDALAERR